MGQPDIPDISTPPILPPLSLTHQAKATEPVQESFDASSSDNLDNEASTLGKTMMRITMNPVEASHQMIKMMSLLTAWMTMTEHFWRWLVG